MDYINLAWQALAEDLGEFTLQIEKLQNKLKNEIDTKNKLKIAEHFKSSEEILKLKDIKERLIGIEDVY